MEIDQELRREMIVENYEHPFHKGLKKEEGYVKANTNNESCIDNIDIQAKIENGVIEDIRFDGEACAICTSSTSIMTELLIGKTIDDARVIIENYMNMIFEKDYDPEILEEAIAFYNTHKQANRIKCATLGWKGITQLIDESEKEETHGK